MSSPGSRRSYLAALGAGIAVIAASTYGVGLTRAAQSMADAAPAAATASVVASESVPSVDSQSGSTPSSTPSSTSAPTSAPPSSKPAGPSASATPASSSAPRSATSAPTSRSSSPPTTSAGSTETAPATSSAAAPVSTSAAAPAPTTAAPAPASQFKDGSYSATAEYNSPGGVEKLGVTVTLAGDVVTGSSLELLGGAGIAHTYQSLFQQNYAAKVTGQKIDTIKLGAVGGSSLTSGGFNAALEAIETQARA